VTAFSLDERLLKLGMIRNWKANKGAPYAEDMVHVLRRAGVSGRSQLRSCCRPDAAPHRLWRMGVLVPYLDARRNPSVQRRINVAARPAGIKARRGRRGRWQRGETRQQRSPWAGRAQGIVGPKGDQGEKGEQASRPTGDPEAVMDQVAGMLWRGPASR
jgi:hypothetical protein